MPKSKRSQQRKQRQQPYRVQRMVEPFVNNKREVIPLSPRNSQVVVTLRFASLLTSGVTGLQQHYFSIINPTKAVDGAGTYVGWTNFEPLYDMFRPRELAMTVVNISPNITAALRNPIFLAADYSAPSGTLSIANILAYSNLKVVSPYVLGTTTFKFGIPQLSQDTTGVAIQEGGWINTAVGPTNGVIFMSAAGHEVNTTTIYVILEMVVEFKNRSI